MAVPEPLASALASLPTDPRFQRLGGWDDRGNGVWSFPIRVKLSVAASDDMPEWSEWQVVVEQHIGSSASIEIYPASASGIAATFQHQSFNAATEDGEAWRTGNPCLGRPASVFRRAGWSGEPTEFPERLDWHVGRLLAWIDAAAEDRLFEQGDPFELPALPNRMTGASVGFLEDRTDFAGWADTGHIWGFATLAYVPGAAGASVVADFMDPMRASIRRPAWGPGVPPTSGRVDAVWSILPTLVVGKPWQLPRSWEELALCCSAVSLDLPGMLADAGAKLRRIERPKQAGPTKLLLGFPIAERVGAATERLHWLAIGNMRICGRREVRNGFSDRAGARRRWDRDSASEKRVLEWIRTENWAPDQLRRRGQAETDVRDKSVLLLGGGALGSAVAENLIRMGVSRLAVVDPDHVTVGNLSRHVLTMRSLGRNKAEALARYLNSTMPDAHVTALPFEFPPRLPRDREKIVGWDIVVDCTAEDEVLRAMAAYPWDGEKIFVSLSMTWRAEGLFAFAVSEASFPAIDALRSFEAVSKVPDEDTLGVNEGIGCWHPVFPAAADDVRLWAAIGTKFIRRAVLERRRLCEHFIQTETGEIERHAA